jgi:hypothetical protein
MYGLGFGKPGFPDCPGLRIGLVSDPISLLMPIRGPDEWSIGFGMGPR